MGISFTGRRFSGLFSSENGFHQVCDVEVYRLGLNLFFIEQLESIADDEEEISEQVPTNIWNSLPQSANYLKECIVFSGYDNVTSIITLESEDEQKRMFDFIVKTKKSVPDPKATFGIFEKEPENLMLLPGLKHIFGKFIDRVKKFESRRKSSVSLGVQKKSKGTFKAKHAAANTKSDPIVVPTIKEIEKQMSSYMAKNSITKPFTITSTEDPLNFAFKCEHCRWIGIINISKQGKALLSNVTRHFPNQCNKNFTKLKAANATQNVSRSSKVSTLPEYFKYQSNRFEEKMDKEGVHFRSHSTPRQNSKEDTSCSKSSKNLMLPAGIPDTTENSGR